jgi:hypothetical protein
VKISSLASNRLFLILVSFGGLIVVLWLGLAVLLYGGSINSAAQPPIVSGQDKPAAHSGRIDKGISSFAPEISSATNEESGVAPATDESKPEDNQWHNAIQIILSDSGSSTFSSAQSLAASLASMPLAGQIEATQHIVNLLADSEYSLAEKIYFSESTPRAVQQVIFEDILNRPNALKLPLLVRSVKECGHPLRKQAIENLRVQFGVDTGDDWLRWDSLVRETLSRAQAE